MNLPSETQPATTPRPYRQWVERIQQLAAAVDGLAESARVMRLPPAEAQAWHGELFDKLRPQLDEEHPVLVVAVTGGTNTGKSTLFNHLAGSEISKAEPWAAGTKHPVCLLPRGSVATSLNAASQNQSLPNVGSLGRLFESFQPRAWQSDQDAIAETDEDWLIYREDPSGRQPARLILLDTPDIDSVLRENWRRAEKVRYAADVLVCLLTGQKYNDAAVVDFFRQAAHSDKTIIVVFNLIEWPMEEAACRHWLQTFCERTGVTIYAAYAVPRDRQAAHQHALTFHPLTPGMHNLQTDLAELKFDEIKINSFRGSLKHVLHPQHGLPHYLQTIRARADDYVSAREQLRKLIQVRNIRPPQPPTHLIWNPIWQWMKPKRNWAERKINGAYQWLGETVTGPFRRSEATIEADFRRGEWEAIQGAVLQIIDQMQALQQGRDPILVDALENVVGGDRPRQIREALKVDYEQLPMNPDGFRQLVFSEMDHFQQQYPKLLGTVKYGLIASAVARPALTIFFMGMAVHELAGHVITQAAVDVAVAIGGEVAVQGGGKQAVFALLKSLYTGYYQKHCLQLQALLTRHLIGPAITQIDRLADISDSPAVRDAQRLIGELNREVEPH